MRIRSSCRTLTLVLVVLLASATHALAQDGDEGPFTVSVIGGVGFDPELIVFGGQTSFGPVFHESLRLRPGLEVGIGELTTLLAINAEVIYRLPGMGTASWMPYVGGGPTFGLSHRGFSSDDPDNVDLDGVIDVDPEFDRFDFSDTDFNGGFNFIVGARTPRGVFFEFKATAWGVSNIRMLAGFSF